MSHPILRNLPGVFFPVKDLKLATEWYSDLLERPIVPTEHDNGIYVFDMVGTDIILDSNIYGSPSVIMFDTHDIEAAHAFCASQPENRVEAIVRYEDVSFYHVNGQMVCQAHRVPPRENVRRGRLTRMSHVLVHTEHPERTMRWHEHFLSAKAESCEMLGGLPYIAMERGADLLFDDGRLSRSAWVMVPGSRSPVHAKPLVMLEAPDLHAVHRYLRSKNAPISAIAENGGNRYFSFVDPDGNGVMVRETSA